MSILGYEDSLAALTDRAIDMIVPTLREIPPGTSLDQTRKLIVEAIWQVSDLYGGAATELAVQHLMTERGDLDLPAPEFADTVARGRVHAAVNSITKDMGDGGIPAGVLSKLEALTVKFVRQPANSTIRMATTAAGTRFARKPEAGACAWCIMLASRGAVYTQKTALRTTDDEKYHDGCRCTAIEVLRNSDLPEVNRRLNQAWQDGVIDDSMLNSPTTLYTHLRDSPFRHPDLEDGIRRYARDPAA